MSKNKNANHNAHQNNVPVQEDEKIKMELEENKVNENTEKEKSNVPEHSDQVREIVKKCQEAVNKFDRGWSIKHLGLFNKIKWGNYNRTGNSKFRWYEKRNNKINYRGKNGK